MTNKITSTIKDGASLVIERDVKDSLMTLKIQSRAKNLNEVIKNLIKARGIER